MKAISFAPGWVDKVEPGRPFRMNRGVRVQDQVSRKKLRELGELHTVQWTAEFFKVTPDTVYEWTKTGDARGRKLGSFKVGRHVRISDTQIQEFLGA